jgi:hypothetical protein
MSQTWIHSPKEHQNFPAVPLRSRRRVSSGRGDLHANPTFPRGPGLGIALLVLTCFGLATVRPARAQEEPRSRLPVINKITGGSNREAFSGKVKSVDLKRQLLTVGTVEGEATEYFPIKKNVSVENANGTKLKIEDLTPGTNIIVYYDVKEDRRNVSQIMVLGMLAGEEKPSDPKGGKHPNAKKSAPPS